MRKTSVLSVFFLATILMALAVTSYTSSTYRQNGFLFGKKPADFSAGWKMDGGSAVELPGSIRGNMPGHAVLTNTLPETLDGGSVLFMKTSYQSLEVIIGGESVYTWDIQSRALFVRPFGLSCYLVSLPDSAAGKLIELRLTPSKSGDSVAIYSIALGNGAAVTASLISGNYVTALLFLILVILFFMTMLGVVLFRKRISRQNISCALFLAAFIALSAIWILSDSDLPLLFTPNVIAVLYSSLFSLMLLPAPLLLFMRRFTRHGHKVLNLLAGIVLLNFIACLGLALAGVADLVQTLFISHFLELLTCIVILILSFNELYRYKRRDVLEVFVGLVFLCLFGAASVIVFSVNGDPRSASLTRAGLTIFVLALGFDLTRLSVIELAGSKSYTDLTLSIPSGICRIENFETGRIVFANEFYYRMFGYTEAEARRAGFLSAYDTVLPEDLAALRDKIKKSFDINLNQIETEARHVRKDGGIVWILARYKAEQNSLGAITLVMIDITDRKLTEEKLRISEEEYRIATLHSNKHILRLDIETRTAYRQADVPSVFGTPPVLENVPESILSSGLIAVDNLDTFRGFFDAIFRGDRNGTAVISVYDRATGEYRWFHYDFTTIFSNDSKPAHAIITFYDVTLQRQKELAFQRWQQSYNAIPKNATNYYEYNLTDDNFEHEEGGMLPPIPTEVPRKLLHFASYIAERHIYPEDMDGWLSFMARDRLLELYASGQHSQKTEFRRLTGGVPKWTSVSVQLIPDPYSSDVKGYFMLEDIDERKKAEINLQVRSTLDSLTGLLNRATFIEKFNEILLASDLETQHALIMLDIDNFKMINDSLGHTAGDALLINIASKLKYALRSDDLCGRLGGDEFVIFLKSMHLGKPLETRVNDLCSMICDEESFGVAVSASFGISSFPYDGLTFDELYKKADIALYRAKAQGRGGYAVYDPQLSFDDMALPVTHT